MQASHYFFFLLELSQHWATWKRDNNQFSFQLSKLLKLNYYYHYYCFSNNNDQIIIIKKQKKLTSLSNITYLKDNSYKFYCKPIYYAGKWCLRSINMSKFIYQIQNNPPDKKTLIIISTSRKSLL